MTVPLDVEVMRVPLGNNGDEEEEITVRLPCSNWG